MNVRKITTIFLLILVNISYSQNISILKSEIFEDTKKNSSLKYSLEDKDGGFVTI